MKKNTIKAETIISIDSGRRSALIERFTGEGSKNENLRRLADVHDVITRHLNCNRSMNNGIQ